MISPVMRYLQHVSTALQNDVITLGVKGPKPWSAPRVFWAGTGISGPLVPLSECPKM